MSTGDIVLKCAGNVYQVIPPALCKQIQGNFKTLNMVNTKFTPVTFLFRSSGNIIAKLDWLSLLYQEMYSSPHFV